MGGIGGSGMAKLCAAMAGLMLMGGCTGRFIAMVDTDKGTRRSHLEAEKSHSLYRPLALRGGGETEKSSSRSEGAFDPSMARKRMETMWSRESITFGEEQSAMHIHREEWITDRLCLTKGFEIVRDDLQLSLEGLSVCTADLTCPSVASILGRFSCGESFSTLFFSELSHPKFKCFESSSMQSSFLKTSVAREATGMLGERFRSKFYRGNPLSYQLFNFDVVSHVNISMLTAQSKYPSSKSGQDNNHSCILGCLRAFDPDNSNHVQIRRLLGESNFEFLSSSAAGKGEEAQETACLIAGCILAVQGMREVMESMSRVMDGRGMCHATASLLTDKQQDRMLYCARGSVFDGQIREQGMGTDAAKYKVHRILHRDGNNRFFIKYGDIKFYDIYFMPYPLREGEDEAAKEDEIDEAVALSPEDEAEGSQNMLVALWCKMRVIPPTVLAVGMLLLGFSQSGQKDVFQQTFDPLLSKGREVKKWIQRTLEKHRKSEAVKGAKR
ncbi:hypothetical protein GUITHDRAFT_104313 [Guillardia theta CCMP2712]|uniref:Uncharacterized protein n=1 Tax=Guillardia theta (strain CCMP2712) TaxID=905079 RepID=L1JPT3_GUITC|nr:hypothetical protein GUITHDRAFT_104313 [Guillardia theta CCMP2712]EKX50083.1 hypothetical protein GUITHDRAFT_104313 [Guillardia theta CCMP2712]|eukprot:XP_005837063.1 hypothetical protein GUITHDRAFT_104313 [Guillardia theta CCMP2712]